jgi:hypothetical protein
MHSSCTNPPELVGSVRSDPVETESLTHSAVYRSRPYAMVQRCVVGPRSALVVSHAPDAAPDSVRGRLAIPPPNIRDPRESLSQAVQALRGISSPVSRKYLSANVRADLTAPAVRRALGSC